MAPLRPGWPPDLGRVRATEPNAMPRSATRAHEHGIFPRPSRNKKRATRTRALVGGGEQAPWPGRNSESVELRVTPSRRYFSSPLHAPVA